MEKWFEQVETDERQAQYLRVAYNNTFCIEDDGKQVLCHLVTLVEDIKNNPEEHPEAKLMAIHLLDMIMNNSGIIKDYKFIQAITGSASPTIPKQEPKTESE